MLELTELGKLEDPADFLGRKFPVTTEEEVQEYVQAALARRDLWN
jgi:predicted CopG family antitoxin